ncbi:phosphatase PAP2 family protein [Gelidibacter salicanalis]|uniref:Phosphatase PAP2 family protein n=1 Tax=Gelidibacter salicanalis TaxID=291193 RepID=A0A5C7AI34_9FLAO|nr:phosphatase PAP2 family protein [Gelidibacter salicanalis]TXE05482.1 phosphatase PAP2 family protein [Gelidibacter salicanalis]
MKKILFILTLLITISSNAQQNNTPYEWNWIKDGIWLGAGLGGSAYGLMLIQDKEGITMAELNALDKNDISRINRWAAGYNSESASSISDIPFAVSFAAPLVLLFNDDINDHTGQFLGMYLESLSTTAALFSITAGLVDKSRPYVYDENLKMDRRLSNSGQRSFYSGHVAASATATFFAAKVYSDYNPDAEGKFFIWAAAAAVPATVGYFRIKAGQHFLTDVLIGYGLGAATGILVPELHKTKDASLRVSPTAGRNFSGDDYRGVAMSYTF